MCHVAQGGQGKYSTVLFWVTCLWTVLHLPWIHWVMRHNLDGSYMCRVAQGSQGKYKTVIFGQHAAGQSYICLGCIRQCNKSRMVFTCVILPKVAKANTVQYCFGWKTELHLPWLIEWCDTSRMVSICVMLPKVAKANTILSCSEWHASGKCCIFIGCLWWPNTIRFILFGSCHLNWPWQAG